MVKVVIKWKKETFSDVQVDFAKGALALKQLLQDLTGTYTLGWVGFVLMRTPHTHSRTPLRLFVCYLYCYVY